MRICLISYEYPPDTHLGGIGTWTGNMSVALRRKGHDVLVVAGTTASDFDTVEDGIPVQRVKRPALPLRECRHLAGAWRVRSKLHRLGQDFDIIHASEYRGEAFWLTWSRRWPVITRLATPYKMVAELQSASALERRGTLDWIEKTQTLRSDGVFSSTCALADEVSRRWGLARERVEVIPNSVDVSRVISMGNGTPREAVDGDYLVYFGRVEKRKGVDVLARALPAVMANHPQLRAVFIGKDMGFEGRPMKEHLREAAGTYADRLIFFEGMGQQDLFPLVKRATLVVLPSLWEAFGFVSIEAMSLGKGVIATSGSGFAEIIRDGETGYLVPPGDSEALAHRIAACLDDRQGLERVAAQAAVAAREYEVDRVADRVLGFYGAVRETWNARRFRAGSSGAAAE